MKIIDVHTHYGKWFFPILADRISDILDLMAQNEIERCVMSSTLGIVYDFTAGNEELARDIADHPELSGYVVVNPNYVEASIEEVDRYLERLNFVGVKIHPDYTGKPLDHEGNRKILDHVSAKYAGSRILMHTWGLAGIEAAAQMTESFPELTFIWGHMGGATDWQEACERVKELRNGMLEICCSTPERGKIETAVEIAGAEKILFGSDLTLINPAFVLGTVADADLSEAEKTLILYENAKRVFGF